MTSSSLESMTASLKPYERMKDSGVEWLGEVPEHWRTAQARRYCKVFSGGTPSRSVERYWENGSIPWLSSGDVNLRSIRAAHQFITGEGLENSSANWIRPGSLVLALAGQGKTKGMVATVEFATTCNQSLAAIEPAVRVSRYSFLAYYLESRYRDIRSLVGDGLRDGLNLEHVKSIPTPLPPLAEQTAIARFLDHATSRIDRYIRAKEKQIALLEEYKQVLVHDAVTGRIDVRTGKPYSEYKSSGVEWLGDQPSHWHVMALRRRWSVTDCKHLTVPFVDCGFPLASVRQVQSFELDLSAANHTTRKWFEVLTEGVRAPKVGDLIYCRNVSVGSAALVTTEEDIAMGQDVCLIRSKNESQRWLNYYLQSTVMSDQLELVLVGSTFNRINVEDIKALLVLVPPIVEQNGIASFLDDETKRLDALIWSCRKQQEAMREYRTRLIADVVTGKLDVRKAVAELPDTNAVACEDGVDTIHAESHSHRPKHSVAEEAGA